jgi:hypothetical protein
MSTGMGVNAKIDAGEIVHELNGFKGRSVRSVLGIVWDWEINPHHIQCPKYVLVSHDMLHTDTLHLTPDSLHTPHATLHTRTAATHL